MANEVLVRLDTSRYLAPSDDDIKAAKAYILRRSEVASSLQELASELLTAAAIKICEIAYKYNIAGNAFATGVSYEQSREISDVMNRLEEELLELLEDTVIVSAVSEEDDGSSFYGLRSSSSVERRAALLAFMLSLGHNGANLRDTIYSYMWRFLRDLEAAIAALKAAGLTLSQAIQKLRSSITSIYTLPEVIAALRHPQDFVAPFIRSGGIPYNPDGSQNVHGVPREGFNAIINTLLITNDIIWNKNQLLDFIEGGAAGYYQLRGSSYPCSACDDEVGFHLGLIDEDPLVHPHCCCYRIPIFAKE